MKTLGRVVIVLGIITGVDGAGIIAGPSHALILGLANLAISVALVIAGATLIKRSRSKP